MASKVQKKKKGRDKDEVRLENPVPQLLASYGVAMKGNRFRPFCHGNAGNDFSGKFDNQSCYCYVCSKTFDCFSIVGFFEGIDNLNDQVRFLGGEEMDEDDPKRQELRKKAQQLKDKKAAEDAKKAAIARDFLESAERMHAIRAYLKKNAPTEGEWPSKEWADKYADLQELDLHVADLIGDDQTGGDMARLL